MILLFLQSVHKVGLYCRQPVQNWFWQKVKKGLAIPEGKEEVKRAGGVNLEAKS
jgi:hypothetical protein